MRKFGAYFSLIGLFSALTLTPTELFSQGNPPPVNQTDSHYLKFESLFESELGLQNISDLEPPPPISTRSSHKLKYLSGYLISRIRTSRSFMLLVYLIRV
jgi:hypothetical protein